MTLITKDGGDKIEDGESLDGDDWLDVGMDYAQLAALVLFIVSLAGAELMVLVYFGVI